MGTRYNIVVTATDAATARVKVIKQALASVVSPITNVGKSVKALGKELGVDKLAKSVGGLASTATNAVKSIGGISPALAGVVGVGGLAAIAAYGKQLVYSQAATMRFAATTGVAAQRVQVLESGARLAGLQAADMDGAIQGLGQTLQDARWGRNQGALLMMNRLGLKLRTTKEGAIDTEASLGDLAELFGPGGKLAKAPVQTKALVAQQFGVEALLPVLLQGRKAWDAYNAAAARVKPPMSDADLAKANEFRKSIDSMSLSFDGLGQAIEKSSFGLKGVFDWITQHNLNAQKNIGQRGILGAIGHGTVAYGKDAIQAVGNTGKAALDAMGLTPDAWRKLGKLISAGEGGYNSVNTGKRGGYKSGRVPLVTNSIQSIMDAQNRGDFNAAGKYQVTRETLREAVKALHLDTSQKFDPGMQERIFREYLIKMRRPEIADYISGKSQDIHAAVKAASKEWASIADPDTGKSHYDGIANNKASISAEDFAKVLKAARQENAAKAPRPAPPVKVQAVGSDKIATQDRAQPGSQDANQAPAPPQQVVMVMPDRAPGPQPAVVAPNMKAAAPAQDQDSPSPPSAAPSAPGAPAAPQRAIGGDLGQVWKDAPKQGAAKMDGTITVQVRGLPPGAAATVTDSTGPVKTVLKQETSMPDYNL